MNKLHSIFILLNYFYLQNTSPRKWFWRFNKNKNYLLGWMFQEQFKVLGNYQPHVQLNRNEDKCSIFTWTHYKRFPLVKPACHSNMKLSGQCAVQCLICPISCCVQSVFFEGARQCGTRVSYASSLMAPHENNSVKMVPKKHDGERTQVQTQELKSKFGSRNIYSIQEQDTGGGGGQRSNPEVSTKRATRPKCFQKMNKNRQTKHEKQR